MRPPQLIDNVWIDAAFAAAHYAGAACPLHIARLPCSPATFSVLALILDRGVIAGGVERKALSLAMSSRFNERMRMRVPNEIVGLERLASQLLGTRTRIRSSGVRMRCDNPFTQRFSPPSSAHASELIRHWLSATARIFGQDAYKTSFSWLAYAEFFVFLTIHPFLDGNGRTARAMYVNRLGACGVMDAAWLLALPLSYGGNSMRFHLAAHLAREAEFSDLYLNLSEAAARVGDWFADDIARMDVAVAAGDAGDVHKMFDAFRDKLAIAMW